MAGSSLASFFRSTLTRIWMSSMSVSRHVRSQSAPGPRWRSRHSLSSRCYDATVADRFGLRGFRVSLAT